MEPQKHDLSDRLYGLLSIGIGIFLLCFLMISWSLLEKGTLNDQISVVGDSTISIEPDIAYIDLGVRTTDVSASDVITRNMDTMDAVLAALKEAGIAEEDMQTQNFTVYPRYEWKNDQYVEVGYEGLQNIKITIKDFTLIATVITEAGKAGANQINSVNFELQDYDDQLALARQEAIIEARSKASSIAKLSGAKLDGVLSYYESTNYYPYDYGKGGGMGADMTYAEASNYYASISSGQEEVTLTVNLNYHIE